MGLKINLLVTEDNNIKYVVIDNTLQPERALKSFETEEEAKQFINIFTRKGKKLGV